MIEVITARLTEMAGIDKRDTWKWPGASKIKLEEIQAAFEQDMPGESEPYGDTWKHPVKALRNKKYHLARIVYLMQNPEEINGIEVDNNCYDTTILPDCIIIDGNHRLAAAIALGLEKIKVIYAGRSDIEDYITGKTDERPTEILCL